MPNKDLIKVSPVPNQLFRCTVAKLMFVIFLMALTGNSIAQSTIGKPGTDSTTPLHALQPDYTTPYGTTTEQGVKEVLSRVHGYLKATTPPRLINRETKQAVGNYKKPDANAIFEPGDYRLISYEWGVTYAGMLLAGDVTGDSKFTNYANERLSFLADLTQYYRKQPADVIKQSPVHSILEPKALDDAGALCAAMIKASRAGIETDLKPMIENFIHYIRKEEYRLPDGTLARNRPLPNTLWLDDLFMSVPALAQMGKLSGENKYYDDAVKQILQMSERMFNKEKGIYMHGWVQDMEPHPQFHWARANGWALMAMVELLDVLPEDHAGRSKVLNQLKAHIHGLAAYQSGEGFWHQLIDRNNSYLETSATAIYTFAIARAINEGWVDRKAYGPMALLAWEAVASKVNEKGQVEGTCVGTGMAFDPAFYYYRPINVYAAHSYGPVLLAGAEIISLIRNNKFEINDSALQFPDL